MKSIGRCLQKDWKELLADCFPKILVNILPYFVLRGQEPLVAQQREKANRVYDLLKDSSYLGKQVSGSEIVEVDSEEMSRGQLGAIRFTEASTILPMTWSDLKYTSHHYIPFFKSRIPLL